MDISEILAIALPAVFVLVGVALVWLILELVSTARKTRKTVASLEKQLQPTLKSVENITASLEPVASKVDPLVERVSLTVDAANLEMMRVDKILEDVSEVTDTVSSAVQTVDEVTSAPLEMVTSLTGRIRSALKPNKAASAQSIGLGEQKSADDQAKPRKGVVVQKVEEAAAPNQPVADPATSAGPATAQDNDQPMTEEDRISQILEAAQESIERQTAGQTATTATTTATTTADNGQSSYFTYTDATNTEGK